MIVMKSGDQPVVIAENQLNGKIMASPAIIQNSMLVRTEQSIYCIE